MDLKVQKRLAAQIMNCSPKRIVFDSSRLEDIKQAITKRDLKLLIGDGAISRLNPKGISQVRARKLKVQKRKGRRKGPGTRKGKFASRFQPKMTWMNNVRVQRAFVRELSEKGIITRLAYRDLYMKSKGGYFRSKKHIKLYLEDHDELLADKSALKKIKTPAEKVSEKNGAEESKKKKTDAKKSDIKKNEDKSGQ